MAGEVFRIDIPVNVRDQTNPGLDSATRKLTGFERSAQRTRRQLEQMQMTRWQVTLSALDQTHAALTSARRGLIGITGRTWNVTIGILGSPFRALNSLKNSLFSLPTIAMGIGGGIAAQKGIAAPLTLSNDFADARLGFQTMLGGQEAGDAFLSQIETFAERTPFSTAGLRDLSQRMLAFKFASADVLPYLEAIGDWSGMMGKGEVGIDRVTLALGQIKAKGRVQGDEMLQLTEAGISAYDYLSKAMGRTTSEVMDLQSKGLIPAQTAIEAIITGLRNDFGGGMKLQQQTTRGLWNTIKETFSNKIVKRWGDGISKGINPALSGMVELMDQNQDRFSKWGDAIEEAGRSLTTRVVYGVEMVKKQIVGLTSSQEWKNATTFGAKIGATWTYIKEGFGEWWSRNEASVVEGFGNLSGRFGAMMNAGIMGALGLFNAEEAQDPIVRAFGKIATAARDKFLESFDAGEVGKGIATAIAKVVIPSSEKSAAANIMGVLAGAFGLSLVAPKITGLAKTMRTVGGWGSTAAKGAATIGTTGTVAATGGALAAGGAKKAIEKVVSQGKLPASEFTNAKIPFKALWTGIKAVGPGLGMAFAMDHTKQFMEDNNITNKAAKEGGFGRGGWLESSGIMTPGVKFVEWFRKSGITEEVTDGLIPSMKIMKERSDLGPYYTPYLAKQREISGVEPLTNETHITVNVNANQSVPIQAAASPNDVLSIIRSNSVLFGNVIAGDIADKIQESYNNKSK